MNYIELSSKYKLSSIDELQELLFKHELTRAERIEAIRKLRWAYRYMRNSMFRIMKLAACSESKLMSLLSSENVSKALLKKRKKYLFKRLTRFEFIQICSKTFTNNFLKQTRINIDEDIDFEWMQLAMSCIARIAHDSVHPTILTPEFFNSIDYKLFKESKYEPIKVEYKESRDEWIDSCYRKQSLIDGLRRLCNYNIIERFIDSLKQRIVDTYNYIRNPNPEIEIDEDSLFYKRIKQLVDQHLSRKAEVEELMCLIEDIKRVAKSDISVIPEYFMPFRAEILYLGYLNYNSKYYSKTFIDFILPRLKSDFGYPFQLTYYLDCEIDTRERCLCSNDVEKETITKISKVIGAKCFLNLFKAYDELAIEKYFDTEVDFNYSFPFFYGDEYLFELCNHDESLIKRYLYDYMYSKIASLIKK